MFVYMKLRTNIPVPTYEQHVAEGCPMPDGYLNNRPVYFNDVELASYNSYFISAYWADTDEALDEDELDELSELYSDLLVERSLSRHY